ncbi:DUF1758 domain-containing protein [Trichonephila clavata]|uniref:DUF1758 domain-containing protein n=1 Tax=Trichonephila clavata TaxID=2740835 RepID=A0A8X6LSM3_TRICU|nr:DUF1758 domain-containing protein [Trichonephila clavata]
MFIIQFKLDLTTRGWWERSLDNEKIPLLNELLQFLSNHARSLMAEGHGIKSTLVARKKSASKSINKYHKCGKSHYTLLHFVITSEPNSSIPRDANNLALSASAKVFPSVVFDATNTDTGSIFPNVNNSSITSCSGFDSNFQVLLCTALSNVCDSFAGTQLCRVLLNPGSQACLITNSCLERLGLPRKQANVCISCLETSDTLTNGISEIKFTPPFTSNTSFVTSMYAVNKIVGQLPHFSLDPSWLEPLSDLKLADPTFFKSGPIDILIGVNIAFPMLKGQSLSLGDNKPFSVHSDLGWIVARNVRSEEVFSSIQVNSIQVLTDELVSNFWKLDSVPEISLLTSEAKACEDHFIDTYVRNEDGQYTVRLPFHLLPFKLGNSGKSVLQRLKSLEHSLIKKSVIDSQRLYARISNFRAHGACS